MHLETKLKNIQGNFFKTTAPKKKKNSQYLASNKNLPDMQRSKKKNPLMRRENIELWVAEVGRSWGQDIETILANMVKPYLY